MTQSVTQSIRKNLANWFATPLGQRVLQYEQAQMQELLPGLFGYHIVQFGLPEGADYISSSKVMNKTYLCLDQGEVDPSVNAVQTLAEILPVATDSIDVAVLPHVLEYSADPHRLLRELDRILIDDGHVIFIGINRFSLWGLWHLLFCWWDRMPWSGRLISIPRMKDWLSLLDFEVKQVRYCFYAPPFRNPQWLERMRPLERLGRLCWPFLGGLYVIVGKKRVVPLNPIKMSWRAERQLIGSGMAEPTARQSWNRNG